MNIKLPGFLLLHFLISLIIGIFSLSITIQSVKAQGVSLILPDLSRLLPLPRIISPFRPFLRLSPLRPLKNPFGVPTPMLTLSPTPVSTHTPAPSATSTPTPTFSSTPTQIPTPTSTLTPSPTFILSPTPSLTATPTSFPTPTPTTAVEGLVAYWKMDEGTGTTVTDSSGNGHTLTLQNFNFDSSSGWTIDTPPTSLISNTGSLLFDGINDVGLADSHPSFNFSSSFTLEAWIRAASQGNDIGILSKWGVSEGSVRGYMMYLGGGKIINFINSNAGLTSNTDMRGDNTWHHIATVWDGSQRKIYIDGILQASGSWIEAPVSIDISFMVGNYFAGGDPRNFKGNIDEVKIYNIARTQNEIIEDAGLKKTVVINEIMWMGSNSSTSDEWIELRNITENSIDLTNWTVEKLGSGTSSITVPNGTIAANGFFLISNNTRADSILNVDPDYQTASISLDNGGEQLILKNSSGLVVDIANGLGGWLAGDNTTPKKSMERNSQPGDGTNRANWHSASVSLGLDSGATESATPKNNND